MSATARWSICRSTPARSRRWSAVRDLYRVTINVTAVPKTQWAAICADCAGSIDSLVELLQGRFAKGVMERICRQETGLFPKPSRDPVCLQLPGSASMCKHVAAALYGVGARLDHEPELLFRLRGVNATDLVGQVDAALPISSIEVSADKVLQVDDVSALFGLDMAEPAVAEPLPGRTKSTRRRRTAPTTPALEPAGMPINKRSSRRGVRANDRPLGRKPAPAKTKA